MRAAAPVVFIPGKAAEQSMADQPCKAEPTCAEYFAMKPAPVSVSSKIKVTPSIAIGRFSLFNTAYGRTWIGLLSGPSAGEGGSFDTAKLEAVIAKFYGENF